MSDPTGPHPDEPAVTDTAGQPDSSGASAASGDAASEASAPEPSYGEAVAELDRIVAELENEAIDVDELGARVRRAAELVALCRARIASARLEVDQVAATFDGTNADQGGAGSGGAQTEA